MYFTVMCLFSVSTSSPSQTSCQVVARAKRKYTHGGVPVQVGLIWSNGTNITTRCETRPNQENKTHCKDSQRKHKIHFAAPLVKTTTQYERPVVQSISRDGYYLSLFWLVKNWGNFSEPEQVTRLQDQIEEARWFFSPLKWWLVCCFPTHVIIPLYHPWIRRLGRNESVYIRTIKYALPFQAEQQELLLALKTNKNKCNFAKKKEMECLSSTVLYAISNERQ